MKCYKCDSDYEEEFYKYDGKIYCFDCLTEELENEGNLNIISVTHYYNGDWGNLGTNDEIDEVVQNICEEYEIERIDNDFKEDKQ